MYIQNIKSSPNVGNLLNLPCINKTAVYSEHKVHVQDVYFDIVYITCAICLSDIVYLNNRADTKMLDIQIALSTLES
jgi:hypothetical protein